MGQYQARLSPGTDSRGEKGSFFEGQNTMSLVDPTGITPAPIPEAIVSPTTQTQTPAQIHARFRMDTNTRMRLNSYVNGTYQVIEGRRVELSPAPGLPFGQATPGGQCSLVIADKTAIALFDAAAIGAEFDFLISPVVPDPMNVAS